MMKTMILECASLYSDTNSIHDQQVDLWKCIQYCTMCCGAIQEGVKIDFRSFFLRQLQRQLQ